MVSVGTIMAHSADSVLFCPLWATGETWQCSAWTDEEEPLGLDIKGSYKLHTYTHTLTHTHQAYFKVNIQGVS